MSTPVKIAILPINGVRFDGVDALVLDVLAILIRQFEAGTEFGFFKGCEGFGDLAGHAFGHYHNHIRLTSQYAAQDDGDDPLIDGDTTVKKSVQLG